MRYLTPDFSQLLIERQTEIDSRLAAVLESSVGRPDEDDPMTRRELRPSLVAEVWAFLQLREVRHALFALRSRWTGPPDLETVLLFGSILRRARTITESWGGKLVVVSLPGAWNFDVRSAVPSFAGSKSRESVRKAAHAQSLLFIDVLPAFEDHPDPLSLYAYRGASAWGQPHMNAEGYALVADIVGEALEGSSLLPR
jgi:hypothetical protein